MRLGFIIIVILIVGALFIIREQQTDFKSFQSTSAFTKVYSKWIWQISKNVRDIVLYSIKLNWVPDIEPIIKNSTNSP